MSESTVTLLQRAQCGLRYASSREYTTPATWGIVVFAKITVRIAERILTGVHHPCNMRNCRLCLVTMRIGENWRMLNSANCGTHFDVCTPCTTPATWGMHCLFRLGRNADYGTHPHVGKSPLQNDQACGKQHRLSNHLCCMENCRLWLKTIADCGCELHRAEAICG